MTDVQQAVPVAKELNLCRCVGDEDDRPLTIKIRPSGDGQICCDECGMPVIDDDPKTFRELAEAAIADLGRYADDELPHRRMVSYEAYWKRFELLASLPCKSGEGAEASVTDGWTLEQGRPAATAPYACHVLGGRLDETAGEWVMAVVSTPLVTPFTHWWPLPGASIAPDATQTREAELASRCDGKEQLAFEEWAKSQRYDMNEHPLHYLFLDAETSAARDGWAAGLKYASDIARDALNARGGA